VDSKVTIADLLTAKRQNRKIVAVSRYDYTAAKLISQTEVEMVLVGDSAAQVVLGFDSTLPVTMDFMVAITAAVRRGALNLCLVANMPFLSYQTGKAETVKNAGWSIPEDGVQIPKLKRAKRILLQLKQLAMLVWPLWPILA